jgi:branched-chain amino acid transport system substrate-binding protein
MKQFRTFGLGLLAATMLGGAAAQGADEVKVGLVFSLSGPPAVLGEQARDGFLLAVEELGGKLGGLKPKSSWSTTS